MRAVPEALQAQLDTGATTHCRCWRVDRAFGGPLGFTDHDCNLIFGGVVFEAETGFAASGVERGLGLSVDNASAAGALRSDRITDADIQAGAYDGAQIRLWIVDWLNPDNRMLAFRGEIGEIRRGAVAFEVELRGLAERLNRPVGRHFMHVCDAALGDGRCGVDAEAPAFRAEVTVAEVVDARTVRAGGLGAFEDGWFDEGVAEWLTGALAGRTTAVATHRKCDGVRLAMTADMTPAPAPGDAFAVTAGCDKRFETCAAKFANTVNFRGFPFMPGDGWVVAYPVEGGVYDGGSLG